MKTAIVCLLISISFLLAASDYKHLEKEKRIELEVNDMFLKNNMRFANKSSAYRSNLISKRESLEEYFLLMSAVSLASASGFLYFDRKEDERKELKSLGLVANSALVASSAFVAVFVVKDSVSIPASILGISCAMVNAFSLSKPGNVISFLKWFSTTLSLMTIFYAIYIFSDSNWYLRVWSIVSLVSSALSMYILTRETTIRYELGNPLKGKTLSKKTFSKIYAFMFISSFYLSRYSGSQETLLVISLLYFFTYVIIIKLRLNDLQKSNKYLLLAFIPIINVLFSFYLMIKDNKLTEEDKAKKADQFNQRDTL